MDALAQAHPVTGPGYYRGRHYTSYVEDVKALKRSGDTDAAARLLLAMLDAVEAEGRAKREGVAPWYYEELAKLYRERKDCAAEVATLERFQHQRHAPGAKPPQLLERLEKARALLANSRATPANSPPSVRSDEDDDADEE